MERRCWLSPDRESFQVFIMMVGTTSRAGELQATRLEAVWKLSTEAVAAAEIEGSNMDIPVARGSRGMLGKALGSLATGSSVGSICFKAGRVLAE